MLSRKNFSKSKVILMGSSIGVIWIIIGAIIFKNFFPSAGVSTPVVTNVVTGVTPEPTNTGENPSGEKKSELTPREFFSNDSFTKLQMFGELPLTTGKLGRDNPFEPVPDESAPITSGPPGRPPGGIPRSP